MLKRFFAILFAMMLTVFCLPMAVAEENAVSEHLPESIDEYDIILLGYPNWWASIPMPIATLLESYDFSGKTILPFCSHGGGRFGQSLTAIAKLAPQAVIAPGLSVHYSGGSGLPNDVQAWLESQGIPTNQ